MDRKRVRHTVVFEPAEEGGYTVTCSALPGLVTQGRPLEEPRCMPENAIQPHVGRRIEYGLPVPEDNLEEGQTIDVLVAAPA